MNLHATPFQRGLYKPTHNTHFRGSSAQPHAMQRPLQRGLCRIYEYLPVLGKTGCIHECPSLCERPQSVNAPGLRDVDEGPPKSGMSKAKGLPTFHCICEVPESMDLSRRKKQQL